MFEYSVEKLYHFNCSRCKKWFTIADYKMTDKALSCPNCFTVSNHFEIKEPMTNNDDKDINSSRYFISGTYRSFDHMSEDYEYIDFSHIVNLPNNFTLEDVVKATKELNNLLINLKPTHIRHISKL